MPLPDLPWKWKGNTSEMCLISGSWSLEDIPFWCWSVCGQEKGQLPMESIYTHVRSFLLQFSRCHGLPSLGKVQTKSENQRSASAVAFFIRFDWKHRDDYDLLAFLRQLSTPWPQVFFWNSKCTKRWQPSFSWSHNLPISSQFNENAMWPITLETQIVILWLWFPCCWK